MRRVHIDEIAPGMKLARTLHFSYGGVMLAAGATLDDKSIDRLREFGYSSLYVHDEDVEDVVVYDYIDEKARLKITKHVTSLYEGLKDETKRVVKPEELAEASQKDIRARAEDPRFRKILDRANLQEQFMADVESIMEAILSDREMALCVGTIKTVHSFLYDHSLEVAFHSAILARHLGFQRSEIKEIILGSLLHDIGQIFIPEDIVKKKGPLTVREEDILKQHTVFGYYLLKERSDVSLLSAHIAYQHHEQQDGEGYPRGLKGTNRVMSKKEALGGATGMIHRYADIVAVPVFYDELTSDLTYRPATPPDAAVQALREAAGTVLNREVVNTFLSYLPVFPMGTSVVVVDGKYAGWRGVVVALDPSDLARPQVRLLFDRSKRLKKPVNLDLRGEEGVTVRAVWK
jgi:putative nucleotidyltransferase with HDIG domain